MANLELVKKLREATGCGIGDCNKALSACGDNYEESVDWLRKKGLSSAAKKNARATTEGLIGILNNKNVATIVEVNSETDFVAANDKFQTLVCDILGAGITLENYVDFVTEIKDVTFNGQKISDELTNSIAVIGENLRLRRGKTIKLSGDGLIVSYLHNAVSDKLGKIGVLVSLKSSANKEKLQELGKQIAMHIAASKPEFLNKDLVPAERLQREKDVFSEQARNSGKPENIIEKMIDGRIRKFYEEVCLLDQNFIMDDKKKISDLLKSFEKENGSSVEIADYVLYVLGEGLEKNETNFADEVNSIVSGNK